MSRPLIQPEPIKAALKRLQSKLNKCVSTENMMVYFHANRLSTVMANCDKYHKILASGTTSIVGIYDVNADYENIVEDVHAYYDEFKNNLN